jgi:hypothetical protein
VIIVVRMCGRSNVRDIRSVDSIVQSHNVHGILMRYAFERLFQTSDVVGLGCGIKHIHITSDIVEVTAIDIQVAGRSNIPTERQMLLC